MQDQTQTKRVYILALALAAWIFFISGMLATSNDVLKPFLQDLFDLSQQQSSLAHFSFYVAYFFMAIPGGRMAATLGYRKAIPIGMSITFLGTLTGIVGSYMGLFGLYLLAMFIMATGIAVLVVIVNAYVARIGDPKSATSRLNLVNAFYGLGAILGPIIGGKILLKEGIAPASIHSLNLYILFTCLAILSLMAGLMIRFPELDTRKQNIKQIFGTLSHGPLRYGVLAMFLYVGAEVSVASLMIEYLKGAWNITEQEAAPWVSTYWASFMILRLMAAPLGNRVSGLTLLKGSVFLSMALVLIVIFGKGMISGYAALGLGVGHALAFPAIFALSVRGLGDRTQDAGSLVMMAGVGGALISLVHGTLVDWVGLHLSYFLSFGCYLYILWFSYKGSQLYTSP